MVLGFSVLFRQSALSQPSCRSFLLHRRGSLHRGWSLFTAARERQLVRLKHEAARLPQDPEAQAAFLRALGQSRPAEVVQAVESGVVPRGSAVATEYIRALSKTNTLSPSKIPLVLSLIDSKNDAAGQSFTAFAAHAAPAMAPQVPQVAFSTYAPSSATDSSHAAIPAGSSAAVPFQVALAEPSLQSRLWKLVGALGTTFLVLGFLGVLMEERGAGGMARVKTDTGPEPDSAGQIRFSEVAGAEEAKEELIEIVEYLKNPETFSRLGGKVPKGILLVGPPGTGKTLLAKAVAGEAKRPFFYASGSSFEEMYVGVGAKRVRELFAAAKRSAPCIVFIDEIDALGAKRSPRDGSYVKLAFFELLQALDGFRSNENVIVIAATNAEQSLDPALTRPGRFDRHITVPNPDVRERQAILGVHTKEKVPLAEDVDLEVIARGTPGFSGADLANLVNSAAVRAAVDGSLAVGMSHLEHAKDKILMGAERKSVEVGEETRKLTSYHEGGHALCAMHTAGAHPVHKATIVPRGGSLGMVAQLPDKDRTSMSRQQMLARLVVCMGGRAAEELVLGEDFITSGAQSDFAQATELAEAMVTKYGLSPTGDLGHMVYDRQTESPETRAVIDREMKQLLHTAYQSALVLLRERRTELENISYALLDRETLTAEELRLASRGELPSVMRCDFDLKSPSETQEAQASSGGAPSDEGKPQATSVLTPFGMPSHREES